MASNHKGKIIWNRLPVDMKTSESLVIFKRTGYILVTRFTVGKRDLSNIVFSHLNKINFTHPKARYEN